jgi:glycogen phosphorylase
VRRRVSRQCRRRGESDESVESARNMLDPNILTIGFARRFATYKRADMILSDLDRFAAMTSDPERPIQLIFAGKAHPADEPGKRLVQRIANLRHDPRFAGRIAFVEDYDINVCRHLVQGVDVWLNTPRRPLEASGTSGQKAVLNGALHLSILDGWWAEAYDGSNGFAIGEGAEHANWAEQDNLDAESLYRELEQEVVPLYYARDRDGIPHGWVARQNRAIRTLAWRFSGHRMLKDYALGSYLPAAGGVTSSFTSTPGGTSSLGTWPDSPLLRVARTMGKRRRVCPPPLKPTYPTSRATSRPLPGPWPPTGRTTCPRATSTSPASAVPSPSPCTCTSP